MTEAKEQSFERVPYPLIRWLVGRYHVSRDVAEIEGDIAYRMRCSKTTVEEIEEACRYARECHYGNQEIYNQVMGGMIK